MRACPPRHETRLRLTQGIESMTGLPTFVSHLECSETGRRARAGYYKKGKLREIIVNLHRNTRDERAPPRHLEFIGSNCITKPTRKLPAARHFETMYGDENIGQYNTVRGFGL